MADKKLTFEAWLANATANATESAKYDKKTDSQPPPDFDPRLTEKFVGMQPADDSHHEHREDESKN